MFNVFRLCLISALLPLHALAGTWTELTPLPHKLMGLHAEVIGEYVYTFGGMSISADGTEVTNRTFRLDTTVDEWSDRAPMPTRRGYFGTGVLDGKIYAIGGTTLMRVRDQAISTVEVYDPEKNEWSSAAPLNVPRADLSANVVDGKIYAIGGAAYVGVDALGTVEMYDPKTGTWSHRKEMPTPRLHHTSVVHSGKIYVFGGGPEWPVPTKSVEIYDPATDSWSKGADMPTPRTAIWAAALGGKIYVAGGLSWENEALATVEIYDPATDSWASAPDMPTARFLATVVGGPERVFVIGGCQTDYTTLDATEAFSPD